jgi:hypothetical protein
MIRDQISLAGVYHYTMALAYLIGGAAILVYAILPRLELSSAQALFPPVIGLLLAGLLSILYATIGRGLGRLSNGARMGAIFLALLGSVAGAFAVMGSISSAIQAQAPDWLPVAVTAVASLSAYFLTTAIDLLLLLFLLNGRVRELFYNLEAPPLTAPPIQPSRRKDAAKPREVAEVNLSSSRP